MHHKTNNVTYCYLEVLKHKHAKLHAHLHVHTHTKKNNNKNSLSSHFLTNSDQKPQKREKQRQEKSLLTGTEQEKRRNLRSVIDWYFAVVVF